MNYLQTKYLIIGAGLSGLSAAYQLIDNFILVEASNLVGGNAGTLYVKGFKLDNSIHVLYFKNQGIKDWIRKTIEIELLEKTRVSSVWINNSFVSFPIQYHLNELPVTSKFNSVKSILITSLHRKKIKFENFEEYSIDTFGTYLTDIFIRPYNEKLFGVPISKMNIEWMGDYVPRYSRTKMLMSVTGLADTKYGRNSNFYYPTEGGISTVAKSISSKLKIAPIFKSKLVYLSLKNKTAFFNNGVQVNFNYLINTIPLNSFLNKVDELPTDISDCIGLMKNNSTTILHILCKGNIKHIKYHWIYVPDPAIPFYRITIPGNINPANCPDGYFAITLEFGGDVYKNEIVLKSSIAALKKIGILIQDEADIELYWRLLDCGYVIYDDNRAEVLKKIFHFLQKNKIYSVGRYGSWEYSNMEDALLHGKKIAEKLLAFS